MANKLHAPYVHKNRTFEEMRKDFSQEPIPASEIYCRPPDKKPWDENAFGVLAEKVLCDGCGEEIDPRQSSDLCKSCTSEVPHDG